MMEMETMAPFSLQPHYSTEWQKLQSLLSEDPQITARYRTNLESAKKQINLVYNAVQLDKELNICPVPVQASEDMNSFSKTAMKYPYVPESAGPFLPKTTTLQDIEPAFAEQTETPFTPDNNDLWLDDFLGLDESNPHTELENNITSLKRLLMHIRGDQNVAGIDVATIYKTIDGRRSCPNAEQNTKVEFGVLDVEFYTNNVPGEYCHLKINKKGSFPLRDLLLSQRFFEYIAEKSGGTILLRDSSRKLDARPIQNRSSTYYIDANGEEIKHYPPTTMSLLEWL